VRYDLCGLDAAAFAAVTRAVAGHDDRFHRPLYRHLMATGRFAPDEVPIWREAEAARPGAIAALMAVAAREQVPVIVDRLAAHDPGLGETIKLRVRLKDGAVVESVLIPMGGGGEDDPDGVGHYTVCVSSQVGCRMGCTFCHTATMGLVRHLAVHEIVGQVVAARAALPAGRTLRNVVFMGMGEPLDNPAAVGAAVRILGERCGLSLAARHITVSTVGRVDVLPHLATHGLDRINLAVSLTAADDELRSRLMPINRIAPLAQLQAALRAVPLDRGRRILVGYVVIPGVNDDVAALDRLAAWCAPLRVLINLIPYNPIPGRDWRAPTAGEVDAVRDALDQRGLHVRLRRTKGDRLMAACGQLATARTPRRVRTSA
jgi:23S rRNA (adenine2503-C2)-methyltransferase